LLLFALWLLVQLLAYFEAVIVIFGFAAILAFVSYPSNGYIVLPHGIAVTFVFFAQPCDYWWSNSYSELGLCKRNSY